MEKLCIVSIAILLGAAAGLLANVVGFSHSTATILGILVGCYGAWLGEQLFTKIHH
jgi:uncharacterized membrane protein YeaQ/YmgE (transglycosylase-associated protein family)